MFKSVQGHQYLCDILKKALFHRNPQKEGVGFERKLNPDGTYLEPEQYPKTVWVLAKENPIDIANLSGFNCKIIKAIVENHSILTTSLSKIRKEKCLLNSSVLLRRMVSISDRFGFANL